MTFRNLEDAVRKGRALEFLDAVPEAWRRGVGGGGGNSVALPPPTPHSPVASRVSKQSPGLGLATGVLESTGHA